MRLVLDQFQDRRFAHLELLCESDVQVRALLLVMRRTQDRRRSVLLIAGEIARISK